MTWQAVTFVVVAAVLIGGFWWYERSRPPSRIVALVAALAALAVAGRLAFAPIPNVLATTDIVLFTGYAVGAGPGFVVGSLAALVSNFWLGQGPWTPWQMAGWGMIGIGGTALAALTGRRLGRVGLAAACGIAGLAYGALLDLSVMVTYGGEQSLDRYLALSARGIPFNLAHAAGNVALALVAGPTLVRMLERYRARCEFRWRPARPAVASTLAALLVAAAASLVVVGGPRSASAIEPQADAAAAAADGRAWLVDARNDDGGFGTTPGGSSSASMTGWAMLGLESAGRNPLDLGGRTPVDFLRAKASKVRSTGDLERTILALAGAGLGARDFGGRDLVAALRNRRSANGSFQGQVNLTAFGVFALKAAGAAGSTELSRSARWLRKGQNRDGGWGYQPSQPSEPDSTGAALQALAAAGSGGGAAADGGRYLKRAQERDGGWALAVTGPTNSQSTAWAVQGLIAAGSNPASATTNGNGPFDYLNARQASDGHYRYSASSDQTPVWVTSQALIAVGRKTFPLAAVPRAPGGSGVGDGSEGAGAANGGKRSGKKSQGGEGKRSNEAASASKAERVASDEAGPPGASDFEQASGGDGDPATPQVVLGGLGLLALALVGGFFVYRRRLPG